MNGRQSSSYLSILNLVGFLGTAVVNALANILPINNRTTGELSDLYPNLFTPAGLTFAIWGLIYVLLAIFVVYQLLPSVRRDTRKIDLVLRMGPLFFISCLANIGWIFAWHYEIAPLSLGPDADTLGMPASNLLKARHWQIGSDERGEVFGASSFQRLPGLDYHSHDCQCHRLAGGYRLEPKHMGSW